LFDVQQDLERLRGENKRDWYYLGFESERRNALWDVDTTYTSIDAANGQELWSDNGTTTAAIVADINQTGAGAGSSIVQLVALGTTLYFAATDGIHGKELWKSDGSSPGSPGTAMVYDIIPGSGDALLNTFLTVFGTSVYFPATADTLSYNLWSYSGSGTPAPVSTLIQAGQSAMIVYNGALYLRATDGTDGYELYKYDGITLSRVADINPGPGDGLACTVTFGVYNNALYFGATDGVHGNQLYKCDGTGVTLVKTINPTGNANPGQFAVYNERLYFQASDGSSGAELWVMYYQ
jgi:ELWxxDGT repeat protein